MPELVMMVGVPGCGKSTYIKSKEFLFDSTWVVISLDNIIEELGNPEGLNYTDAFAKFNKVAAKQMKKNLKDAIATKKNIIWDQTNLTVKSRKNKLKGIPEEYNLTVVAFEISSEELNIRYEKRKQTDGKTIPEFVRNNMCKSYQRPTVEEGFNRVQIIYG